MKYLFAVIILLGLSLNAQADVFNLGTGYTNLETVRVGDAGNVADTLVMNDGTTGYGSVDYNYNIGKYEVTAGQYCDFLNNKAKTDTYGLYNTYMADTYGCKIQRSGNSGNYAYTVASDWANRPVNWVSFWDACRFTNWLSNGQGDGDTEAGAYTLNDYNGSDGRAIQRNSNWKWAISNEDEWYKAAYYQGGGSSSGYWLYPTNSNSTVANRLLATDPGNSANYCTDTYTLGGPYWLSNVGEFENSGSAYCTFDQGGNVREWNESVVYQTMDYAFRGLRGGTFYQDSYYLKALCRDYYSGGPSGEDDGIGFRVVQAVPEPSSITALFGGLVGLLGLRCKK